MSIRRKFSAGAVRFVRCEGGAITVDWIALTAGLVFMGIATAFYIASAVPELADEIAVEMDEMEVGGGVD